MSGGSPTVSAAESAVRYGPFMRSSYRADDAVGYTSSPPSRSMRPRGRSWRAPPGSATSSRSAARLSATVYVASKPSPMSATKSNQQSPSSPAGSTTVSAGNERCSSRLSVNVENAEASATCSAVRASSTGEIQRTWSWGVNPSSRACSRSWATFTCGTSRGPARRPAARPHAILPQASRPGTTNAPLPRLSRRGRVPMYRGWRQSLGPPAT
jgi:hypothetical protein